MGKKSRLKAERAQVSASMLREAPAPTWAGWAILLVGVGFILTSLVHLGKLSDLNNYRYVFQDSSPGFVQFRYLISCSLRLFGLALGFGLCFRKEWFRKAALLLTWGTMALVYWRHPYAALLRHIRAASEQMTASGLPFSPESLIRYLQAWNISWATEVFFAKTLVVIFIVSEVLVSLCVILILTRSAVKSLFR